VTCEGGVRGYAISFLAIQGNGLRCLNGVILSSSVR